MTRVDDPVLAALTSHVVRTVLLLILLIINVGLVVVVVWTGRRQRQESATVRALLHDNERTRELIHHQQAREERQLQLLAELAGHVEIALQRKRLSPSSRELLEQADGPAENRDL